MADINRDLIIYGFRVSGTYVKRGIRNPDGSPGPVLNEKEPEYWVKYANRATPQSMATEERLRHLDPDNLKTLEGTEASEKAEFFRYRWAQIKPAFDAWLSGQAMPEYGVPLAAWPALNADQLNALKVVGLKSIEDVRDMHENLIARVRLPNVRELKRAAQAYLEALNGKEVADKLEAQQTEINGLREQLEAAMALLEQNAKANAETLGGKKPSKAA